MEKQISIKKETEIQKSTKEQSKYNTPKKRIQMPIHKQIKV